jgi:hypothetical protein
VEGDNKGKKKREKEKKNCRVPKVTVLTILSGNQI